MTLRLLNVFCLVGFSMWLVTADFISFKNGMAHELAGGLLMLLGMILCGGNLLKPTVDPGELPPLVKISKIRKTDDN